MTQQLSANLIDAIYAAALEMRLWPRALQQIESSLGLEFIALAFDCPGVGRVICRAGTAQLEIINREQSSLTPSSNVNTLRSEKPHQWTVLDLHMQAGIWSVLSYSSSNGNTKNGSDPEVCDLLVNHIGLALKIGVGRLERQTGFHAQMMLLDALGIGAVFLSKDGIVLEASTTISRRYASSNLPGMELQLESAQATASVLAALNAQRDSRPSKCRVLFGPSGMRPDSLAVLQFNTLDASCVHKAFSAHHALLLIMPISRNVDIDPAVLQRVFSLTPRESVLAVKIARGSRISKVAQEMDITVSTARFMMNQVFQKTGAKSQARLVATMSAFGTDIIPHVN